MLASALQLHRKKLLYELGTLELCVLWESEQVQALPPPWGPGDSAHTGALRGVRHGVLRTILETH